MFRAQQSDRPREVLTQVAGLPRPERVVVEKGGQSGETNRLDEGEEQEKRENQTKRRTISGAQGWQRSAAAEELNAEFVSSGLRAGFHNRRSGVEGVREDESARKADSAKVTSNQAADHRITGEADYQRRSAHLPLQQTGDRLPVLSVRVPGRALL